MAILKVDTISGIGTEGPVFEGDIEFTSQNFLTLPKGDTNQRGRGRALILGGIYPETTRMETYSLINFSGSVEFGTLSGGNNLAWGGALGSSTRSVIAGGNGQIVDIEFVEVATLGNSTSFGNLSTGRRHATGVSNNIRGMWGGGETAGAASQTNLIDFVTIASTGDAQDFGDLTLARRGSGGGASPTRAVFATGSDSPTSPGNVNNIDFVTIASAGNATDFGDAQNVRANGSGCSNATRMVIGGGGVSPSGYLAVMEFITISTTGNATDFGDMPQIVYSLRGCSASHIRGNFNGGAGYPNTVYLNVIQSINFSTTGDAVDFGDMKQAKGGYNGTTSDSHGGLSE